ncbi:MAG: arginine--tRNA ligase, partial [Patescibacteria group bacterium]
YKVLGVKFDTAIGESFYEPKLKGLIQSALEQGIAKKGEDGSVVIMFKDYPPELIQKSDGATLFTTRELASIKHRIEKWKAQKIIYVADNGQSFHLEQVFRAAGLLGYAKKEQLVHVKFGVMLGPDKKKFATREGKLIPLEDVLKVAIERARKVVEDLNSELSEEEKNKAAKIVGIGAVKYADLHQNRVSDIVFDWDKMLNLKGGSAPYIQYTYARLKSILRKAGKLPKKFNIEVLKEEKELAVLREFVHFPEVVVEAGEDYLPNLLSEYVLRLAEKLNVFYESHPVLKAEKPLRQARLGLISAGAIILALGLKILGISVPEKM